MTKLGDIVKFRSDMLFQGAVNLSWFSNQKEISNIAASAFVFHGPNSHGFAQREEFGVRLPTDTASFVLSLIRRACGIEDSPFVFAIAGYGTGKSHLALTAAELLHNQNTSVAQDILQSISTTDSNIGHECTLLLKEHHQPSLVITINGMGQYNLVAAMTSAAIQTLKADGEDTRPVDALRPRFERAASMLNILKDNKELVDKLCEQTGIDSIESIIEELSKRQNENVFENISICLNEAGCPLDIPQLESLKELFSCIVDTYCGVDKKYKSVVILFDEFGKYLEFAIEKPVIAGSSVLQDMFEAIQESKGLITFTGFIQFELKAYAQRMPSLLQNEASRYITRYDSAEKKYLSTNMETLIANLIEKKDIDFFDKKFNNDRAQQDTAIALQNLQHYFKDVDNYTIWKDPSEFHVKLCRNCWPLSPYSLWFFLALASGSRFLQERSILSLLDSFFKSVECLDIKNISSQGFLPAQLFSSDLLDEFISSEKFSEQGSIAHALKSVLNKHGSRLDENQKLLLKSVVIAEKLGLIGADRSDVVAGLCLLCGISISDGEDALRYLQNELNVIEWDEGFKTFDILSDAIPRTQFISFLRQRLSNDYDDEKCSKLFEKYIDVMVPDVLQDVDTDFGEENRIQTSEWRYSSIKTNELFMEVKIKKAVNDFYNKINPVEAKGTIIYVYISKNSDVDSVRAKIIKNLKEATKEIQLKLVPIIISIFYDEDGKLAQYLAEYDILENLSGKEKEQFSNLVLAHKEKICFQTSNIINEFKKQHYTISLLKDVDSKIKVKSLGLKIFENVYTQPISFEVDGFTGSAMSGMTTTYDFSRKLIFGALDYDKIKSLKQSEKNRATKLLQHSWGIYEKSGSIAQRPKNCETLIRIFKNWDVIRKQQNLSLKNLMAEIIAPPYGANVYSALLAISVYISARIPTSYIKNNDEVTSVKDWAEYLFDGVRRKIDRDFFGNAELVLDSGETQEWNDLLNEWEDCELYDELISFPEREKKLRKNTPPSPELYDRIQVLFEKSKHAKKEIEIDSGLYEKASSQIESGKTQDKFHLIIFGSANLQKMLNKYESSPYTWQSSQQIKIENELQLRRQVIIRDFDDWGDKENPRSENPEHISQFNSKLKKIIQKLKYINLHEQSVQLESLLTDKIKNADIIAKYKVFIDDAEKFVQVENIKLDSTIMSQLKILTKTCEHYTKELEKIARNRNLPRLKEVRCEVNDFKITVLERQKRLKEQLNAVMGAKIINRKSIIDSLQEFEKLRHIFLDEINYQDILDCETFLKWLDTVVYDLGNLNLANSVFEKELEEFYKKCGELIEENELPWGIDELFECIEKDLRAIRRMKSQEWRSSLEEKCDKIFQLTVSQSVVLKNELQQIPAYAHNDDISVINNLLENIDTHLGTKKVEWLVQEFKSLSQEHKNKVLELIR